MKYRSFDETLEEELKDPREAVHYLNAVIEEGDTDALLLALAHVARAQGVTRVAKGSGLQREAIYKMLRHAANPEFRSIMKILQATGIRFVAKVAREKVAA